MLATTLPAFHRWFLATRASGAPGIVLYGDPALPKGLAAAVARHLNEFDDDSKGNWTAFAPELIAEISESAPQRGLLGLPDGCKDCPPNSPCGRKRVLQALGKRGQAVLDGTLAVAACAPLREVFRVSLGPPPETGLHFHLVLHPEHFSDRSLASIIGDTFLEWDATRELADSA
ncbi:hypothetical protein [Luteolibacter luteus]|uniref:Uncharacterized protein n=1 Tax=Luteolibacter luteus TaxID=2728835 RepID=A0A858RFQ5_9BACT|nr:hypothetical protein [Luteolibacter luteus]QJE95394.1 hypothetical protein HHL09_06230 [Luteolibacter luteus]